MSSRRLLVAVLTLSAAGCSMDDTLGPSASLESHGTVPPMTRVYYIAADEVVWDYAPSGRNLIQDRAFTDEELVFVGRGAHSIGSRYKKALYREYTNASFTTLKGVPAAWQHLGNLGPLVRGVVGDSIVIVFKNNTKFPASIHPHGVLYDKANEGAPYSPGGDNPGAVVPPGGTFTYRWFVPERAGPGPADGSTVMWMYHSHVDEVKDVYSGLVGPIIVTSRIAARADGSSLDYDREFISNFEVSDENNSHYIDDNIAMFTTDPDGVDPESDEFIESNLMHSINGYVYGNLPVSTMSMRKNERVRWYLMAMGTEVDLHTPHWHGITVLNMGMRMDVVELLPAAMKTVDVTPDNPGTWLFHCHVADHILAGMAARFRITS